MTPLTITGGNDLKNISIKATNIARILQSLDGSPSNNGLIKIPSSLKDLNVSNIDLESDADLGTILEKAQILTSKSYVLKDSETAKADMTKYISAYRLYGLPMELDKTYYSSEGRYFLLYLDTSKFITYSASGGHCYEVNTPDLFDLEKNNLYHSSTKLYDAGLYLLFSNRCDSISVTLK